MEEKFIVFGTGCFWCSEAIFKLVNGVTDVVPGYAGGHTENPTYRQVCTDRTGHAEVVKISYNPEIISLRELLDLFLASHDPTSMNRQGNDIGTQYRSIVFYNTPEEEKIIKDVISEKQKDYKKPIVTEVKQFEHFYEAEDYHHNYFANNPSNPYCSMVIKPEVNDFIMRHGNVLKTVKH